MHPQFLGRGSFDTLLGHIQIRLVIGSEGFFHVAGHKHVPFLIYIITIGHHQVEFLEHIRCLAHLANHIRLVVSSHELLQCQKLYLVQLVEDLIRRDEYLILQP